MFSLTAQTNLNNIGDLKLTQQFANMKEFSKDYIKNGWKVDSDQEFSTEPACICLMLAVVAIILSKSKFLWLPDLIKIFLVLNWLLVTRTEVY